jgi:hypothetical protein
VQLVTEGEVL